MLPKALKSCPKSNKSPNHNSKYEQIYICAKERQCKRTISSNQAEHNVKNLLGRFTKLFTITLSENRFFAHNSKYEQIYICAKERQCKRTISSNPAEHNVKNLLGQFTMLFTITLSEQRFFALFGSSLLHFH